MQEEEAKECLNEAKMILNDYKHLKNMRHRIIC